VEDLFLVRDERLVPEAAVFETPLKQGLIGPICLFALEVAPKPLGGGLSLLGMK